MSSLGDGQHGYSACEWGFAKGTTGSGAGEAGVDVMSWHAGTGLVGITIGVGRK